MLDEELRFEVQPRRKAEVLVGWACVAVNAAVFAPAVGIDRGVEPEVGAVVIRDDRLGGVPIQHGREDVGLRRFVVNFEWLEPADGVPDCTPTLADDGEGHGRPDWGGETGTYREPWSRAEGVWPSGIFSFWRWWTRGNGRSITRVAVCVQLGHLCWRWGACV